MLNMGSDNQPDGWLVNAFYTVYSYVLIHVWFWYSSISIPRKFVLILIIKYFRLLLIYCLLARFLHISPSDCQVSEQSRQGVPGCRQPPQHTAGDDVWECAGKRRRDDVFLLWTEIRSFLSRNLLSVSVSFRNVMPSANSSSWWKPGTLSWVSPTWSLCSLAPGIWVTVTLKCVSRAE